MITEWLMLSSWATSGVVVRWVVDDPLNWSLSTSDGRPLHCSSSRRLSPLQSFLNHRYTVLLLAVPGPNALVMLQVVSTAL